MCCWHWRSCRWTRVEKHGCVGGEFVVLVVGGEWRWWPEKVGNGGGVNASSLECCLPQTIIVVIPLNWR